MELGNVAQWFGALATSTGIVFALFREEIIRRFRHPELTARIEARYPDCVKTPLSHEDWHGSKYFLRLWIKNEGKVRADKVEVFLSRAWVERGGSFESLPDFTPMNLRWSYSDYYRPTICTDGISPHMGRYCDFAAITDPAHPHLKSLPEQPENTRLGLQFEFLQPTSQWLPPGKYKLEILVAANNSAPVAWIVELDLKGLWSNDDLYMLAHGFVVKVHQ